VGLSSMLFNKFPSQIFASMTPVIVSYLCGGLTNLLKGIRRDALLFLIALASGHNSILTAHADKVRSQ
jgi:hypothetical protein